MAYWFLATGGKRRNSDIEPNLPWNNTGSLARCINNYSSLKLKSGFYPVRLLNVDGQSGSLISQSGLRQNVLLNLIPVDSQQMFPEAKSSI